MVYNDDTPVQSDWNEQLMFSNLFFTITLRCRNAQSEGDVIQWKNHLESKMSLAIGISTKNKSKKVDERKDIIALREEMNRIYGRYILAKQNGGATGKAQQYLNELANKLFYIEADIDIIVNKHMPFLNIPEYVDLANW